MSKNIQITEIHNFDVDCVVDDETIRYLILKHIAEKSGVRLDLLRTYCGVKIIDHLTKSSSLYTASVRGEIPGRFELRRGSEGEAPVHGMPHLEVKMDDRALGAIERIRELVRKLPNDARLEAVSDIKMMEYRKKFIRDAIYTTIRILFPINQPVQNMTEKMSVKLPNVPHTISLRLLRPRSLSPIIRPNTINWSRRSDVSQTVGREPTAASTRSTRCPTNSPR